MDKDKRDLLKSLDFIIDNMATKDDLVEIRDTMATKDDLERLETKVDGIEATLHDHSRDLEIIKGDVKSNLDKRMQLEVRVTKLEQKVH